MTPWAVHLPCDERYYVEIREKDRTVGKVIEAKDAAHIVHCVNTHEALVEALETMCSATEYSIPQQVLDALNAARKES
jgi:molybdopterin-guanine dinucleotide biosynthesis protein A